MNYICYKDCKPVNLDYTTEIEVVENSEANLYSIWFIKKDFNHNFILSNIANSLNPSVTSTPLFNEQFYDEYFANINGLITWDFATKEEREAVLKAIKIGYAKDLTRFVKLDDSATEL